MWEILKVAFQEWSRHRTGRLAAALAYYSVFSIGPLLLIVTAFASFFFTADFVRGSLVGQFRGLLGKTGGDAVETMLAHAISPDATGLAALVGIVVLLVAAVGVVAQLKDAMNTIWDVRDPKHASAWWYVRTYLVSFAGILALGFLLATSLVVSAALAAISAHFGSTDDSLVWQAINFVASFVILAILFGALFKFFPDTEVAWRDVIFGAIVTSILFDIGKALIGWYVGSQGLESTYGAVASILILLIWVYYSAQIVLFGAELTHAYATRRGSRRAAGPGSTAPHKADTDRRSERRRLTGT
ncbi:MAG TPA: YihY/virulence factor BrkB family protein [Bauldia sp.]|nr:YihY/virulence factor BrkB family protein [Bauldia sp.]